MSDCEKEYKNKLNFLPRIKTMKLEKDPSDAASTRQVRASRTTERTCLNPKERQEAEIEMLQIQKEIEKWEKIKKNNFMKRCLRDRVNSMAPKGFDSLLENIMAFVIYKKPCPSTIKCFVSSYLETKLDKRTMNELDIDDKEKLHSSDFGQEEVPGNSGSEDPSSPLEVSEVDPAPSNIDHVGYKGNDKPPWYKSVVKKAESSNDHLMEMKRKKQPYQSKVRFNRFVKAVIKVPRCPEDAA